MRRSILLPSLLLSAVACKGAPPQGTAGPEAEALAKAMQAAVHGDAWRDTGAVEWNFAGRNAHLWDRRRGFSRVSWGDTEVLFAIDARKGLATEKGEALAGEAAKEALDGAHARWTNDAFWLNPVMKAFDPGTVRELLPADDAGRRGLLVRYASGGRTPGDAYLWLVDAKNRPVAWKMWTSNIPVGGVEASWENWVELGSGATISTKHETRLFTLELTDVKGARTLAQLHEKDPFAPLTACLDKGNCLSF